MSDKFTFTKASGGEQFLPHPADQFAATCVDFLDLGEKVTEWQGKTKLAYKVAFVFATGERKQDGSLHTITKECTASMHEKATLRKFLEEWRGKTFTDDEVKQGIPADKFVGAHALVVVEHNTSKTGDRVYANLKSIQRLPKGMSAPDVSDYQRAPYWTEKKAAYALGASQYHAEHDRKAPEDDFEDFEPVGRQGEEELPFTPMVWG